jgi:hypothetical protein
MGVGSVCVCAQAAGANSFTTPSLCALLYCRPAVLPPCCTAALLYCCPAVLPPCCTAALLYCRPAVLPQAIHGSSASRYKGGSKSSGKAHSNSALSSGYSM